MSNSHYKERPDKKRPSLRKEYYRILFWTARYRLLFTRAEKEVLEFIAERTLRWNRWEENIPIRVFMNGVFTNDGEDLITCGLSYSKNTINQACHSLAKREFIFMRKVSTLYYDVYNYKINFDAIENEIRGIIEDDVNIYL